jgi:hypothetical protein
MSRRQQPDAFESERIFHEHEWRIQRIGWCFLTIFLALAFAGLFGNGPLSHASASGAQGIVEYERFIRYGTPSEIVVTPAAGAVHGIRRIEISSEYLEGFRIEHITPEPASVRMSGPRLIYEFTAAGSGAAVSLHVDPQRLWRHRAVLQIDGGAPLAIWQLTYP